LTLPKPGKFVTPWSYIGKAASEVMHGLLSAESFILVMEKAENSVSRK
jgi:hypothetical protein